MRTNVRAPAARRRDGCLTGRGRCPSDNRHAAARVRALRLPRMSTTSLIAPAPGLPLLIQGGMGVGVSHWRLARAVSRLGHLGVVSGTALDTLLVRRLQDGDPGGHVRRAMAHFPIPEVVSGGLRRYFLPGARPPLTP